MSDVPIRPAATVVVVRDVETKPKVLMGQRGKSAAFMPNKFVFPGGAVDISDADIDLAQGLTETCQYRLMAQSNGPAPHSLAAAAIRELWEETGLILGTETAWFSPHPDWDGMAGMGFQPSAAGMHYFFRAITPPGRPRRFDARFFLVDASAVVNDLDDFSAACEELSHLQWVSIAEARALDLPFITEVVLGELSGLSQIAAPKSVPFFDNTEMQGRIHRLA